MCFSANASFVTSAVVFSAGLYAVIKAIKSNQNYLPLSLIPIIFGIQQFSEGIIWQTIATTHGNILHSSALIYMFFAFLLWPAYFPFCLCCIEPSAIRRKALIFLMILGLILGLIIYIPLLTHEVDINIIPMHKSITYSMEQSAYSQRFYTISYALIIFFSSALCSQKEIKRFGELLFVSFLISITWFLYAFTSIWCYFAAFLSLYIVYFMFYLPKKHMGS